MAWNPTNDHQFKAERSVVADPNTLFDWIAGTALIAYLERLDETVKNDFIPEFKRRMMQKVDQKRYLISIQTDHYCGSFLMV